MLQAKRGNSLVGKYDDGTTIITDTKYVKMEKGLKIWQALVSLILVSISVGTIIVNLSNKVETQRIKIEYLESTQRDFNLIIKDKVQSDNEKFDDIRKQLTEILVELKGKKDATFK